MATERLLITRSSKDIALDLTGEIVASSDSSRCYGDDIVDAAAAAGDIVTSEVKRLLCGKYRDFKAKEFNLRVKAALQRLSPAEQSEDSPYLLTDKGSLKSHVANAITMMSELPLAYNSFSRRAVLTGPSPWGNVGEWTDTDDIKAAEWCQRRHLDIKSSIAFEASQAIAKANSFNPVTDYLESLQWDGVSRLDCWLHDYLGCADNAYTRGVASKWMISGVARVMEPGCQCDYTLVLEGAQGKRKSTAMRTLAGQWFTDDISDIGKKDSAGQLDGNWIVELAELDAFRKAEMTTIKAWLVRRTDNYRPAYGRRSAQFPRQNIFAASTNKDEWGQDETGLRRFWPVKVSAIDIEGLAAVRDQLWAEAFFRYSEGESRYLAGDTEAAAALEQHERQETDTWKERVEDWSDAPSYRSTGESTISDFRSTPERILLPEVLFHCLGIPSRDWNPSHRQRVSRILRLAGYVPKRAARKDADSDGRRPEYWVKNNLHL